MLEEDESAAPEGWLSALGQMSAALVVVFALIALFIGGAVTFRWLFFS